MFSGKASGRNEAAGSFALRGAAPTCAVNELRESNTSSSARDRGTKGEPRFYCNAVAARYAASSVCSAVEADFRMPINGRIKRDVFSLSLLRSFRNVSANVNFHSAVINLESSFRAENIKSANKKLQGGFSYVLSILLSFIPSFPRRLN